MLISLDLHSHSGYSGGVGQINLDQLTQAMALKGLDVFGTGDALHPLWLKHLKENLIEAASGIFNLKGARKDRYFMLQTEIIVSFPFLKKRKSYHLILFFPSYQAVDKAVLLLEKWSVKNTIGRPFIVCDSLEELSNRLFQIKEIDSLIEIIPAHILTPDGVLGSENPVFSLEEAFGKFYKQIQILETGLSADPQILEMIPELKDKTYISNSDCHSADLKRIGREFTKIHIKELSYLNIIDALRTNQIAYTGEFSALEGRYFLTGHRKGKRGHETCGVYFSPDQTPKDKKCPICHKPLTIGVLERAYDLALKQGAQPKLPDKTKRNYITMVPLLEGLAAAMKKGPLSKKVMEDYLKIVTVHPETEFWFLQEKEMKEFLMSVIKDESTVQGILEIKNGNFTYDPIGFDGSYGSLKIGNKVDLNTLSVSGKIL